METKEKANIEDKYSKAIDVLYELRVAVSYTIDDNDRLRRENKMLKSQVANLEHLLDERYKDSESNKKKF